MNNLDKQYQELLQDILDNGYRKEDRTGTGTISVFGRQIRHKMSEGFPLLTTKKMAWKTMVTELLWFLRGDTNIKFLVDNNCHIWDGDALKAYHKHEREELDIFLKAKPYYDLVDFQYTTMNEFINKIKIDDGFAKKWGSLGPVYGSQWRSWGKEFKQIPNENGDGVYDITTTGIDQIQNLINDLKTNPDSRRLMVTAWNPADLEASVLPPCHYGFQVYTRELSREERYNWYIEKYNKNLTRGSNQYDMDSIFDSSNIPTRAISLMWNQRSCDFPLGIPFNVASYGLLLEIIAKEVNMVPDELIGNLGDCHIYLNQIDGVKEQLTREPFELPTLSMDYREGEYDKELKGFVPDDFVLFNYQSHPSIKMPLSN
jgi:thymidylate synthase